MAVVDVHCLPAFEPGGPHYELDCPPCIVWELVTTVCGDRAPDLAAVSGWYLLTDWARDYPNLRVPS